MLDGEHRAVHFVAHLHLIAAVDEQHCAVGQDDRHAGRAGKAGEPGEPLVAWRQIFVLKAVGARHDEAVEPAHEEFGAQRLDPLRRGAAISAVVE